MTRLHAPGVMLLLLPLTACASGGHVLEQKQVATSVRGLATERASVLCDSLARKVARAAGLSHVARMLLQASLERHEGTVVRWATPRSPIRVWVEPRIEDLGVGRLGAIDTWTKAVQHAVANWDMAGAGIRLRLSPDSASADVRIRWTRTIAPLDSGANAVVTRSDGRSGVVRDAGTGAIERAELLLGETEAHGGLRRPVDVHAIAIHELGHALGLAHAVGDARSTSVMAPRVVADEVSGDDRRALRAWYALPLGLRCIAAPTQ